jgi:hypothetical protein
MSLQYMYRIHETTISRFVPEVCDAIYSALKNDYLRVSTLDLTLRVERDLFLCNYIFRFPVRLKSGDV